MGAAGALPIARPYARCSLQLILTRYIFKQRLDKFFCVEWSQVFQAFPYADKADRQPRAFSQRKQDTAFGGAVELGQCQPGHAGGIAELFGLLDGILAGAGVQYQQYLMGGRPGSASSSPG